MSGSRARVCTILRSVSASSSSAPAVPRAGALGGALAGAATARRPVAVVGQGHAVRAAGGEGAALFTAPPLAPFAAGPLMMRPKLTTPGAPVEDLEVQLCAVPKKKVSVSRRRIRNQHKVIPFTKFAVKCRICNKIKLPKTYCDKGCAIPRYMVVPDAE